MAARIKSSSGINGILFPTEFPVNNKLYKLLVKQRAIPRSSKSEISRFFTYIEVLNLLRGSVSMYKTYKP